MWELRHRAARVPGRAGGPGAVPWCAAAMPVAATAAAFPIPMQGVPCKLDARASMHACVPAAAAKGYPALDRQLPHEAQKSDAPLPPSSLHHTTH